MTAAADPAQKRRIKPRPPELVDRALAFLKSREVKIYAESIVITAVLPLVGFLVQREDPLFLRNAFSWLAVPPILVALRHGFGPGVTSAIVLVIAVLARHGSSGAGLAGAPSEQLFGVILIAMVVGQVVAAMVRKFTKMDGDYRHLRAQFEGFMRSHALLELSHERLEQRSVSGLSPLRAALSTLWLGTASASRGELRSPRQDLASVLDETERFTMAAEKMLAVMAMYGRVQGASVHAVDACGAMVETPLRAIGGANPVAAGDTLVVAALATGDIVHSPGQGGPSTTSLVAAIPLVDAEGGRLGVVAIHSLPFVALEASNLRLLFVVAGYVADQVRPLGSSRAAHEDGWREFASRIERAAKDARDARVPSATMAFWCAKGTRGTEVLETMIAKDLRATDCPILRRDAGDNPLLLVVMPLTDRDGALAFCARLDRLCLERFGAGLAALGARSRTWLFTPDSNKDAILAEIATVMEAHEGAALASAAV